MKWKDLKQRELELVLGATAFLIVLIARYDMAFPPQRSGPVRPMRPARLRRARRRRADQAKVIGATSAGLPGSSAASTRAPGGGPAPAHRPVMGSRSRALWRLCREERCHTSEATHQP